MKTRGLQVSESKRRSFQLHPLKAVQVFFPFLARTSFQPHVSVELRVKRRSDGAKDAFRVKLPMRPDRKRVYFVKEQMVSSLGRPFRMAGKWPELIRKGSGRLDILVAVRGDILRAVAGLEYLLEYPYGCTEQRVSRAYPMLVLEKTLRRFAVKKVSSRRVQRAVRQTLRYLKKTIRRDGLFGYWPGSTGYVWLTAYVVPFIVEAKKAGYRFPQHLLKRSLRALRRSLRSDVSLYLSGYRSESQAAVVWALAQAGQHEASYVRHLFRRRHAMDLFARTRLLLAMMRDKQHHSQRIMSLSKELWRQVLLRRSGQRWTFQGMKFYRTSGWYGVSLSSRTRTVAGLLEALSEATPADKRLEALKSVLLDKRISARYGYGLRSDGRGVTWGNTQDNARALLALRALLKQKRHTKLPKVALRIYGGRGRARWSVQKTLDAQKRGLWSWTRRSDAMPWMLLRGRALKEPLWIRARYSYLPSKRGFMTAPLNKGFTITRSTEVTGTTKGTRYFDVKAGMRKEVAFGAVLEEQVRVINPHRRYNVAIEIPFAAGLEVMNAALKTTSSAAKSSKQHTLKPTHQEFLDDRVRFFFDAMPAGNHTFYFRLKATTSVRYTYPACHVESMYRPTIFGRSPGYTLVIKANTNKKNGE
ncbi:MAG TPA: hypothetical protein DCE42_06330 [Myxococcales bacterium]|nr:hypothetical protein [Myxococcales bacterium]